MKIYVEVAIILIILVELLFLLGLVLAP